MPLINRFTRLLSADLHAVLDRIEEPEVLLRQAVREMQAELERLHEQRLAAARTAAHAAGQAAQARQRLARLEEELDVCFTAGEETLARSVVRRKLETERRLRAAEQRGGAARDEASDLERTIENARDALAAMREKLELAEQPAAPVAGAAPAAAIGADEVEAAFLREKQLRSAR